MVSGTEHLDGAEGKVVVCNHVGWADPLWVGYSALPHTLHQMAKKELFDNPVIGWFVRSGGGFPIDRGRPSAATIKQVISLVQQGKHVLIFPMERAPAIKPKQSAARQPSRFMLTHQLFLLIMKGQNISG